MGECTGRAGYGVDGSWGAGRPRRYNIADDLLGAGSGHGSGYCSEDGYGHGGGTTGEDGRTRYDGTGNGIACGKGSECCYGIGLGHRRR